MGELKQITIAEIISVALGLLAGTLLLLIKEEVDLVPGLFVILPGLLQMRGSVTTIVSSRISSALHLGTLTRKELRDNILFSLLLSLVSSITVGLVGTGFVYYFAGSLTIKLLLIALFVGVLSSLADVLLVVYPEVLLFRKGIDPDNVMGPYISSIDDFVTLGLIMVMLWIL